MTGTGYAKVYIAHGAQHLGRSLMCGGKKGYHVGVDSLLLQDVVDEAHDGLVALIGILAPLENTGIATFQAKAEYIKADIGACLIDDANDTEGHGDATKVEPVV